MYSKTIKQFKNDRKWNIINDRIYYFGVGFSLCMIIIWLLR